MDGNWEKLITNDTSVKINRENLIWRQKGVKRSFFTHRKFDCRQRDGETFAHFIAETALFVCEEERKKIPFHLFSPEILSLRDSAGCSVAVVLAANDVFPMEMLRDENIDTDPLVPFYLLFYDRINGDCDGDSYYRDLEEKILTKERLINNNAGDIWHGTSLAVPAALSRRIPEWLRYDPDILKVTAGAGWSVLEIFASDKPDYVRRFPVESMTPEVLGADVNLYIEKEQGYRIRSLRDLLVEAGKFPEDEPEAMLWLTFGNEDDEKVRTAEIFFQVEYPEQYREIIKSVRDAYRKKCSGLLVDLMEPSIL